jgi:hypothetical protein
MPATIFSGSDIKTLKDNLSLNDKAKILPVSGSPASGAGVAAPIGSLALDYTNGKTYKKIGALDTDWSELGSGIGGINYVTNTDAEAGTTGWSTYADAAGAQPVDGTGGSPSVTWTRSTTTPLRGTADFNLAKDAANRQGQGVATDITINLADQAKVLTVSFDYEILSGTYATGDLTVYLIQDPAGTPVVIQPAGYQVQSATAGTKMRQIATFQTAATGQSYRICFHVASTSASAYALAIDNVICGPQVVQYGAPVTDWVSFTPTGSWTTNTTYTGKWRRVGDSMEIETNLLLAGAPTATALLVNLPSGFSIDTAKLTNTSYKTSIFGQARITDATGTNRTIGDVAYNSATSIMVYYLISASNSEAQVTQAAPFTFAASDEINMVYRVPILGWSSTVQMSNDTDTRVVAARASGDPASATSGNPIIFPTTAFDTHGAYNSSTGRYTVSVPGFYRISGAIIPGTGGAVGLFAYVNAVSVARAGNTDSNTAGVFTVLVQVNAGDLIDIRPNATLDAGSGSVINFERLSGPSAIAASESVIVSCIDTSGVTIGITDTDAGRTLIQYAVEEIDTHGAFSSGIFTAPISGKYEVSATYMSGGTTISNMAIHIYKNGASLIRHITYSGGATINHMPRVSKVLTLNAGDTVEIRGRASTATTLDTSTNPTGNMLSIRRVGN